VNAADKKDAVPTVPLRALVQIISVGQDEVLEKD